VVDGGLAQPDLGGDFLCGACREPPPEEHAGGCGQDFLPFGLVSRWRRRPVSLVLMCRRAGAGRLRHVNPPFCRRCGPDPRFNFLLVDSVIRPWVGPERQCGWWHGTTSSWISS